MDDFEPKKDAVCIICFQPNPVWFEFLSGFSHYDTYIAIDDNSKNYSAEYKIKYTSVHIIQYKGDECEYAGFRNINYSMFKKEVTAWEKALFYFSHINKGYGQVWLFEDDVFFYNEDTLKNIDIKFADSDLLTAPYKSSAASSKDWWWWPKIKTEYEPPYYNAMVCGARVSNDFLVNLNEYAEKNNTLFFLEALFPTVAIKTNLQYDTPREMTQVFFRRKWPAYTLSKKNIFHPIKDLGYHQKARKILSRNNPLIHITFHLVDFFTKLVIGSKEKIKSVIRK